jgi:hypothetical protein
MCHRQYKKIEGSEEISHGICDDPECFTAYMSYTGLENETDRNDRQEKDSIDHKLQDH